MSLKFYLFMSLISLTSLSACKKKEEDPVTKSYLYVSSGLCYSGSGITTFSTTTSSNVIYKIDTETGQRHSIIADYNSFPATLGDSPISIVNWNDTNFMVMVRNGAAASRLETLPKESGNRVTFGTNPGIVSILPTSPLNMTKSPDGGLLVLRTGFVEKITSTGIRPSTPWVNSNLGPTCGATNTLLTSIVTSTSGRIVAAHAATSPNNRLISVPAAGASGSCSAARAAPATTTFPTAMVMDRTNEKLIVAYAGAAVTTDINSIYVYDFDDSTGVINNPQKIYDASLYPATYSYLLFGISAMTLDTSSNTLYVSTAISTAATVINYAIEKFAYDPTKLGVSNTTVLTRATSTPFYNYGVDTKCISQMLIDYVRE